MNILTVCALLLVPASPTPASTSPVQSAAVALPAVVVKLGEASLEEYRFGDPINRVQLLRDSQSAKKQPANEK